MKLRAARALHAVLGPQRLLSIAHAHLFEGMLVWVRAGERLMSRRMPVLGENDVLESRRDGVDDGDDLVAAGNGQGPAGAEIILHVGDEEDVLRIDLNIVHGKTCGCTLFS